MSLSRGSVYARALRDELHVSGPADLDLVARKFNLVVREVDLTGCEGVLLRSSVGSSGIIAIKQSIRELGRKRFTVAHEIGHRILHGISSVCTDSDIGNWSKDAKKTENEADEFAAQLLLPSREIRRLVNSASPSIQKIQTIAQEYRASLSAAAWQYCDVSTVPCAIIWSRKEVIQWSRKSDSFQFFLRRGMKVPLASYAMAGYRGKDLPENPEPVAAHEWIDSDRLRDGAEIWEQSLRLRTYDSVLTLLWIKRPIAEERPDEDSLLPELDPDEFTLRRKRWPGKR